MPRCRGAGRSAAAIVGAVAMVALGSTFAPSPALSQSACALEHWPDAIIDSWTRGAVVPNAECYADLVTSMDLARTMRDQVVDRFDQMFPRAAYKVVGLDPVNAALDGVDRPMVGVMYVSMFLPNGSTIPLQSAARLITEPDLLVSVGSERINEATSLEDALPYLDRVFAFIEVPAPLFDNSPANPFLMQASNLLARWGVIGESVKFDPDESFVRSLETMTVTFRDGDGAVLARQPGSYLSGNPLQGVMVVIDELRRRGERLYPGDLISPGAYMPPMPVVDGLYTEAVYEGIGGQTLRVAATYR